MLKLEIALVYGEIVTSSVLPSSTQTREENGNTEIYQSEENKVLIATESDQNEQMY